MLNTMYLKVMGFVRLLFVCSLRLQMVLTAALATLGAADLDVRVVDEEGKLVWARLEIRGPDGKTYQPAFALRDRTSRARPEGRRWYLGSFVAKEPTLIEAPAGDYTIVVERGPEYERFEETITLTDEQPVDLTVNLNHWIDMNALGWYSADFHVHRPVEDVKKLALAEDLNLSVVFTMWNKRDLWEGQPFPVNPVVEVTPRHLLTILNAEDERGGGAWMMHGLREKLNLAVDGRWFPPGLDFLYYAKRQRYYRLGFPWIDVEKPFWWEVPVVMALSPPDSFGVLHNHFNQYGIHDSEAWGKPRDQERFPGAQGFVDSSLSLYYRYLNLGMDIPASAGSATGVLPNPLGYNRVYVRPREAFSAKSFYDGLRYGSSFVTNGPMLFFDAIEAPREVQMTLQVQSREPIERVEIVANGRVIKQFEVAPNQISYSTKLVMDSGVHSWVAARCFVKSDDTIRLAHSRPVFLVDGFWDAREDAEYFAAWMDELIAQTREDKDRFNSEDERRAMLGIYNDARQFYLRKAR